MLAESPGVARGGGAGGENEEEFAGAAFGVGEVNWWSGMKANINKISKRAKWVIISTTALAFPNFIIFWLVAVSIGGDALNGYVNNNHYFICAHGACHEVSKSIWTYSYWHASSALFGIFLIFAELALFVTTKDIELEFD